MRELASAKKGAEHLRQSIMKSVSTEDVPLLKTLESHGRLVLKKGLSRPILLEKNGEYIRLSKGQNIESGGEPDFTLLLRLIPAANSIEWWPVEWSSREGEKLVAEINRDGRRMTNLHVQNELIEIANTWGKSISAQRVSRELEGTL
jgi:hypothetical protein